ncbi:Uncharacterized protein DAT39_020870 [Clarias magur]|uniref:Uncharacterized protein n=1 Tax=Clarias magur TaxID=1594786 RepID=A0A8J4X0S2_CLAMG|nr:Uncharacterized protein DAT39_020870 [Clarias magur]
MFRPISEEQNALGSGSEVKDALDVQAYFGGAESLGSGSEVKDALDVQAYFRGAECLWISFRGERRTGRSGLFRRSRISESLVLKPPVKALGSGSEVKDALDVQTYFGGAECPWIWFRGIVMPQTGIMIAQTGTCSRLMGEEEKGRAQLHQTALAG